MGSESVDLKLEHRPSVILMAGLNGAGKTTLAGKLALFLKTKKNRRPLPRRVATPIAPPPSSSSASSPSKSKCPSS